MPVTSAELSDVQLFASNNKINNFWLGAQLGSPQTLANIMWMFNNSTYCQGVTYSNNIVAKFNGNAAYNCIIAEGKQSNYWDNAACTQNHDTMCVFGKIICNIYLYQLYFC